MFLYLAFFMVLFVAVAFGPTYLLVRRTKYAPYSILLSFVTCQPILVVSVSVLGYRLPAPLRPWQVFLPVAAGTLLTGWVACAFAREIGAALREAWKATLLISGLALASMAAATPLLPHLSYIDWWNGELINYAYFAHSFLGRLHDPNYLVSFEQSAAVRYGAELFLACLSVLTGKAPLMLVEVLSALHKCAAIAAFGIGCDIARRTQRLLPGAALAAGAGFAFAVILALNNQLAFLAAQAVEGSFILLSLLLLDDGVKARRVQLLLALHVLFIVITYAEALPLLLPMAGLVFAEALWKRRRDIPAAILAIFGMGVLANPWLTVSRIGYLYRLRSAIAGFNVIGDPKSDLPGYLASALGYRYPFLPSPMLPPLLLWAGIILGLAAVAGAFLLTAWRMRSLVFLAIPALLVLSHFDLGVGVEPPGCAYYKCYKLIAAFYFYLFFSLAFLLDALLRSRPWRRSSAAPAGLLLAGGAILVMANLITSTRAAAEIRSVPSVYREKDVERALAPARRDGRPVAFLINDISASFWDLMANYLGVPRRLLDLKQAEIVYHNPSPAMIEPMVFPQLDFGPPPAFPETKFSGRLIISRIASYSPGPRGTDVRAAVRALAPDLSLQVDREILSRPAFTEVEGALVANPPGRDAVGSLRRPPLAVVGITPNGGRGSKVTLGFVYFDPRGEADVDHLLININEPSKNTGGCFMSYNRNTNQLGLVLDGDKTWDAGILGTDKKLENGKCEVDCAKCWTSGTGDEFTLHIAFEFKPTFAGRKLVSSTVADARNATTGWEGVGWWEVP